MLSACAPSPLAGIDVGTARVERLSVPLQLRPELDLVFVVDNSPAMRPHRDTVLANARAFIGVLRQLQGGLPDVHIGIVTADVGTRGALDDRSDPRGDCTEDGDGGVMLAARVVNGNYLVAEHGELGTAQNFAGALEDAFAGSLAEAVTASGCSFSRPRVFERLHSRSSAGWTARPESGRTPDGVVLESAWTSGSPNGYAVCSSATRRSPARCTGCRAITS